MQKIKNNNNNNSWFRKLDLSSITAMTDKSYFTIYSYANCQEKSVIFPIIKSSGLWSKYPDLVHQMIQNDLRELDKAIGNNNPFLATKYIDLVHDFWVPSLLDQATITNIITTSKTRASTTTSTTTSSTTTSTTTSSTTTSTTTSSTTTSTIVLDLFKFLLSDNAQNLDKKSDRMKNLIKLLLCDNFVKASMFFSPYPKIIGSLEKLINEGGDNLKLLESFLQRYGVIQPPSITSIQSSSITSIQSSSITSLQSSSIASIQSSSITSLQSSSSSSTTTSWIRVLGFMLKSSALHHLVKEAGPKYLNSWLPIIMLFPDSCDTILIDWFILDPGSFRTVIMVNGNIDLQSWVREKLDWDAANNTETSNIIDILIVCGRWKEIVKLLDQQQQQDDDDYFSITMDLVATLSQKTGIKVLLPREMASSVSMMVDMVAYLPSRYFFTIPGGLEFALFLDYLLRELKGDQGSSMVDVIQRYRFSRRPMQKKLPNWLLDTLDAFLITKIPAIAIAPPVPPPQKSKHGFTRKRLYLCE